MDDSIVGQMFKRDELEEGIITWLQGFIIFNFFYTTSDFYSSVWKEHVMRISNVRIILELSYLCFVRMNQYR